MSETTVSVIYSTNTNTPNSFKFHQGRGRALKPGNTDMAFSINMAIYLFIYLFICLFIYLLFLIFLFFISFIGKGVLNDSRLLFVVCASLLHS